MMKINRRDFESHWIRLNSNSCCVCSDPISWDPMVPIEHAYYVAQPEEIEPGNASYITRLQSMFGRLCILLKTVKGVLNVEGNPAHPLSQGKICFRGQTGIQETSPDLSAPSKELQFLGMML